MEKNYTAEDFMDMAMAEFEKGNQDDGVKYFYKAAEMGNAVAMCNIGTFYLKGISLDRDPKKAFEWYKKAAEAGHEFAMFQVGEFCSAQQNDAEAFQWYLKSAESGANYAMTEVATIYLKGAGV